MPLDVDAVVAGGLIDELHKLVDNQPHMERGEICDDIEEFVEEMKKKYHIFNKNARV